MSLDSANDAKLSLSEIDKATMSLESSLGDLSNSLKTLINRLDPIMVSENPTPTGDGEKDVPHSEIVSKIHGYSKGIKSMNDLVKDILHRLEI